MDGYIVPGPAFFETSSGPTVHKSSQWFVYDGRSSSAPRASALRADCSCGWHGPDLALEEAMGGGRDGSSVDELLDACARAWSRHARDAEGSAVPLPDVVSVLLQQLQEEIATLAGTSPLDAARAARRMEATAVRIGCRIIVPDRPSSHHDAAEGALGLVAPE
ncbi:hypothetical protein ABZ891_29685 [Streptomyces sp. NPDC047023]|uniref:hypothetical protein n=1 Tax=Streptomyces sp. NPDC047023 TaxID=3155139 RepID=UPI0033C95408